MGICPDHCPPEGGGRSVAAVIVLAVAAATAVLAASGGILAALTAAEAVAGAVMLGALAWVLKYGGWRRPPRQVTRPAPAPARAALTRGPLALAPPQPKVYVITSARERTGHVQ